jgi:uncharacterized protein
MKLLHNITCILVTLAAINWGLVGLFDLNVVHKLFSTMPMVEKGIYIALGIAGVLFAVLETKEHKYF